MKLSFGCCRFLIAWLAVALCEDSLNTTTSESSEYESESVLCQLKCQCPPHSTYSSIICNNLNLKVLPKSIHIYTAVTLLSFKENYLKGISKDTFKPARKLEELDLSANELSHIDNGSLEVFSGLQALYLSHNKFTNISSGILNGLQNLQMLEIGHNHLKVLPEHLFESTPNLRELRLQSNKLIGLAEYSFQNLNFLEKLDLQDNALSYFEANLFQPTPRLQWLSLSGNSFQRVPRKVFLHTKMMTSLDFSGNAFISLESKAFSTLHNLSYLYLNNLPFLQAIEKDAFVNLNNLKVLSCSYNSRLRFLHPEAFGSNFKRVIPSDKLYLGHNGLRTIPQPVQLESWENIGIVELNENPLRCDCNLRWMARLKKEITGSVRCETPLEHHGRTIDTMQAEDFICDHSWAFATIFIMVSSLAVLCLSCAFALAVLCYKTPYAQQVRAKWQFAYAKVNRKNEIVDLEWDPTVDM